MTDGFQQRHLRLERVILPGVLLILALFLIHTDWLWRWDYLIYDAELKLWSRPAPADIVIVAVDEQSLMALGRWPWPRRLHATLIERLTAAGAKAIGLDIIFAEPDTDDPAGDALLAQALKNSGRVILPVLPEKLGGQLVETLPIPMLAEAAARLGHVDAELDRDGIARNVFLKAGLGDPHWSNFGLALLELTLPTAQRALPGQRSTADRQPSAYAWVRDYRIGIPFAGPRGHFAQVSYTDVLSGAVSPTTFRDKFVLIGVTAAGLGEALPTPVSGLAQPLPGIEINATVLDGLQHGLAIQPLGYGWRIVLTALLVLLPTWFYPHLAPGQVVVLAALALLVAAAMSAVLLHSLQLWFAPMPALLALGLSCPLWSWRRLEQAVQSLAEEKARLQVTLHCIGDAVITTDAAGRVHYLNPAAEALTGWPAGEARGRPIATVFRPLQHENHTAVACPVSRCLEEGHAIRLTEHSSVLFSRSGKEYAVLASAAPLRGRRSEITGAVLAVSDVTAVHQLIQQMAYQTNYDALTQLPNRNLLRDRLAHAIAHSQRSGCWVAVLLVDLDQFKRVNDSLGHAAGDSLLLAVATRLQGCIREEDTLARLVGDEFIIVLENLSQEDSATVVARKVMQALTPPFVLEGHEFFITSSIGISLFPRDGEDRETLLRNADMAMNRAKQQGRNNFQFYTAAMNTRALDRLSLENGLRRALEHQELLLHYQPQVDLNSGMVTGVEALLRWQHLQRGMVSPAEFIPLAEETGLIIPIGAWVLKTACAQGKAWQDMGLPALRVAVNLSARQFTQADLIDLITATLEETGLSASCLELEITESLLMENVERAIATLRTLKDMGVKLAIDDFGTGYSSLSYLKRFPLNRLKIDRSFVRDLTSDPDDAAITLAVIAMAHSMRLKVIAEGVETDAQLTFLRAKDCNEIQGYYFSRPLPEAQMSALLRERQTLQLKASN